jgi:hypothetical protein
MCKRPRLRLFSSRVFLLFYRPTDEQDRWFLTRQSGSTRHNRSRETVWEGVQLLSVKLKILGHMTRPGSCNTFSTLLPMGSSNLGEYTNVRQGARQYIVANIVDYRMSLDGRNSVFQMKVAILRSIFRFLLPWTWHWVSAEADVILRVFIENCVP